MPLQRTDQRSGNLGILFLAVSYPESADTTLHGNSDALSTRFPPQLLQVIGSGCSITVFGVEISNPNASSIRVAIFSNGTEDPGCRNP